MKRAPLHYEFIHVLLNGRHNLSDASSLLIGEAEILDNGDGLLREAQGECLDLFVRRFLGQAREVEVGFPLRFPHLEVSPPLEL